MMAQVARAAVPAVERRRAPWMDRVLERLQAEFRHPPTVLTLAEAEGIHPAHLARVFRRRYGTTIAAYARNLRIEHATRALVATGRPLVAIAHEAGFADQSHLTRVFRRATGCTPRVYRDHFRPR